VYQDSLMRLNLPFILLRKPAANSADRALIVQPANVEGELEISREA
jgi:hypothetical protein